VIDAWAVATPSESAVETDSWEGFSLKREILKIEREIISRALRDAGGSVSAASQLLGFKHHQSLIASLNTRHKDLLTARSAVRKRRRHLFSKSRKTKRRVVRSSTRRSTSQTSILHVEDNKLVAGLVEDLFKELEWHVDLCTDGDTALRRLTDNAHYDLLLVDNDLPGLSGMELVRRARKITHRRRTPIVMLSGTDCESEAWAAGVDAFLKKPEQINEVPLTITRILEGQSRHI